MEELELLAEACRDYDYGRSPEDDFDNDEDARYPTTKVYCVERGGETLIYWNSSNDESINHEDVLDKIADELEDENWDGSVQDEYTWAEIMYEVK